MAYTNNVTLLDTEGGALLNADISARIWMTWYVTGTGTGTGNQQQEEGLSTGLVSRDGLTPLQISFPGPTNFASVSRGVGLSVQDTNRVPNDTGWLFRSGEFPADLPAGPIEIITAARTFPSTEVPTMLPALPFTADAGTTTVITSITTTLASGGIDFVASGTTLATRVPVSFFYTGRLVLSPSSDVRGAGSEAITVWVSNPVITFAPGSSVPSYEHAAVMNFLRVFIMRELQPKIRETLESNVNAAILAQVGRNLSADGTLPAGVILSVRSINITADPGGTLVVRGALGAFGGVLNRLPSSRRCFIATAAYGSSLAPEVDFLRHFRDDVLRKTRSGAAIYDRFYEQYYRISPPIADLMRQDDELRDVIRWSLVTPIVNYFQLALRFPNTDIDADIETVKEPWKSFLTELRKDLEEWAESIELPFDFNDLTAVDAAEEIRIILRYVLRTNQTRSGYLARLAELGQIPLKVNSNERSEIIERLRSSGRSEAEIRMILGADASPYKGDVL